MEKKYNAQNETSHTPNSDMAIDYSEDDMEQTKNLNDSNSDNTMSEEFPLHKIETFIKEQSDSNSYMKEYNTDQKHTVINNNISEEPLLFAVETADNVGKNVYDYDNNNNNNHSKKVGCVSNNSYEEDVTHRVSKRRRCVPKVFTPEDKNRNIWCLCQQEDKGFYLVCDVKKPGCLEFYHPTCVGLNNLKSKVDGDKYSNCSDGKSYICPLCASQFSRKKWYNTDDLLSISKSSCDSDDDGSKIEEEAGSFKDVNQLHELHNSKENDLFHKNEVADDNGYVSSTMSTKDCKIK
jgi:hypothetical protein